MKKKTSNCSDRGVNWYKGGVYIVASLKLCCGPTSHTKMWLIAQPNKQLTCSKKKTRCSCLLSSSLSLWLFAFVFVPRDFLGGSGATWLGERRRILGFCIFEFRVTVHAHYSRSNKILFSASYCNFVFCFNPWIRFHFLLINGRLSFQCCFLLRIKHSSLWGFVITIEFWSVFPLHQLLYIVAINPCMLNAWLIVSVLNLHSCLMINFIHA